MKQSVRERIKKIDYIIKDIQPIKRFSDDYNMPMTEFVQGLDRYRLGCFNDSIIHSALSLELGLALKLDQTLTDKDKIKYNKKPMSFEKLLNSSIGKNILQTEYAKDVSEIINLRNMFVHPGNWAQLYKNLEFSKLNESTFIEKILDNPSLVTTDTYEFIKRNKKSFNSKAENLRELLKKENDRIEKIPDLKWMTNKKTLEKQQKIMAEYYTKIASNLLTIKGIKKITTKPYEAGKIKGKLEQEYGYLEPAAFSTLQKTHIVLNKLGYNKK